MMEQKESDDARYSELLTPTRTPVKLEDDDTKGTRASPDSERSPATLSQGMRRSEAYCLLVRVAHNVDSVPALDAKVPDYVWTEVIAQDICTYRLGAPSGTFVVELLSDMEFLLFQGPRSGPRIAWEDTIHYIQALYDIWDWGGTEVTMVIVQRTMRQSWIDLANTREYRQARVLGRLAAVEGWAQILALESPRPMSPQGRGQGYTRRANRYYVQMAVGTPAPELTLNAMRPVTLEDYHSAWESSEFEYEREGSEGPGTDSTGYSSTTTMTSYHDTDHTQCSDTKNRKNGLVVLPLFRESTKEGAPHLYQLETGGAGIHREEVPWA